MTEREIALERAYLIQERLAILTEGAEPTSAQVAMARADADGWEKRHRASQNENQTNTRPA